MANSGMVLRWTYDVETVQWRDSAFVTERQRIVLERSAAETVITGPGFEVRGDARTIVRCDHRNRIIVLQNGARNRRVAATQRLLSEMLPDTLVAYSTVASCDDLGSGGRRVILIVDPLCRRLFNADSLALTIGAAGRVVLLRVYHPWPATTISTSYQLIDESLHPDSSGPRPSVASRYFAPDGSLLDTYASYRVLGRRINNGRPQ